MLVRTTDTRRTDAPAVASELRGSHRPKSTRVNRGGRFPASRWCGVLRGPAAGSTSPPHDDIAADLDCHRLAITREEFEITSRVLLAAVGVVASVAGGRFDRRDLEPRDTCAYQNRPGGVPRGVGDEYADGDRPTRAGEQSAHRRPTDPNRRRHRQDRRRRACFATRRSGSGERNGRPPPLSRSSTDRALDLGGWSHFSPVQGEPQRLATRFENRF